MRKKAEEFRYITSPRWWTKELLVMFVVGLVLATILWLGLWLLSVKPAQAIALQAQKTALEKCLAEKDLCSQVKAKLEADNKVISRRLDEARAGWGRCIRSKSISEN